MEIVFVTAELSPFSKVGGLADVSSALPKALRSLGHRVLVVSPLYRDISTDRYSLARRLSTLDVPLAGQRRAVEVWDGRRPSGVDVCFVGCPGLLDRQVYGEPDAPEYPDNHLRFALLCRAALEVCRQRERPVDILHTHEWSTALVPLLLQHQYRDDRKLGTARTVFTIHNLAHQGICGREAVDDIGLPASAFTPDGIEFYGKVNLLKAGIVWADHITTVSPTYSRQILTPDHGQGLEGLLQTRRDALTGILNGIDYSVWNPATDPALAARFDAEEPGGKVRCKAGLQRELGLRILPDVPLIGIVSRLVPQKGFDLVGDVAARILRQDVQIAVLGSGDPPVRAMFEELARRFPDRVAVRAGQDEGLSHRIHAGSDLCLMPSRFEPSGLTQMYAMRYGAVPIARRTGGLSDSVVDCDSRGSSGTGFLFDEFEPGALLSAVERALALYRDREAFAALIRRCMRLDHSWDRSARMYDQIYRDLVAARAG